MFTIIKGRTMSAPIPSKIQHKALLITDIKKHVLIAYLQKQQQKRYSTEIQHL